MNSNEQKILTRDVEAAVVPVGTKVTLQKGEQAQITQSLGGSYTVVVNGNMFRVEGHDADALGFIRRQTPERRWRRDDHRQPQSADFQRLQAQVVLRRFQ